MSITQVQTYSAAPAGVHTSVSVTLSPSPAAGNLEVAVVYGYNTNDVCYTLTVPSGWQLYDSQCDGGNRNSVWTLSHVAAAGETQYTFNFSGSDYASVVVYDLAGTSGQSAIVGHADQAFVSGTAQSTASLTPPQNGDLAIATFANAYFKDPTVASPFSVDKNADGGIYLTTAHTTLSTTTPTSAKAAFSGAPASGESNILLIAPSVQAPIVTVPAYEYASVTGTGCNNGSQGLSPGANADQTLYWGLELCGRTADNAQITSDCPGRSAASTCQAFGYIDLGLNSCSGESANAFSWANTNDEAAFIHTYPTSISAANRVTRSASSYCGSDGGSNSEQYYMNLGDSELNNFLATDLWQSSTWLPSPWGAFEDDEGFSYATTAHNSTEYGNGYTWQVGTSSYHDSTDYVTANATFVNGACTGRCVPLIFNGIGGAVTPCATVSSGHCFGSTAYAQGVEDNQISLDNMCSHLTGSNLNGLLSEHLIYGAGPGNGWAYGAQIALWLNTIAHFQNAHSTDNCRGVKFLDLADTSQEATIRSYASALQWMAPSADGTPDTIVPWYIAAGQTATEVSYWPEFEIVPYQPEQTLSQYNFNGATVSDGTFCPGNGDTGGIQKLVASCPANGYPVLAIQYHHCMWLNPDTGAVSDKGPCAAILNTSSSNVTITSSFFTGDAIGTYKHVITFSGYEVNKLEYPGDGTTNLLAACTNTTYCSDNPPNFQGKVFAGNGTDTLGPQSGELLTSQ